MSLNKFVLYQHWDGLGHRSWIDLKSLIDIVTLDQLYEATMILWEIWNDRNNLVWKRRSLRLEIVIQKAD